MTGDPNVSSPPAGAETRIGSCAGRDGLKSSVPEWLRVLLDHQPDSSSSRSLLYGKFETAAKRQRLCAILKARVTICVTCYLRFPAVPVRCSDHKTMGKIGLKAQ